jgi:hypothetical protein
MKEPKRLQRRPHYRGMPVPSTLVVEGGVPDFTTPDVERVADHVRRNLCHLCGEPLRREVAFVGGVLAMQSGVFRDGPMHLECARYAFFACPFVGGRMVRYRPPKEERRVAVAVTSDRRPEHMALWVTDGYATLGEGESLRFIAYAAHRIEWDCELWERFGEES